MEHLPLIFCLCVLYCFLGALFAFFTDAHLFNFDTNKIVIASIVLFWPMVVVCILVYLLVMLPWTIKDIIGKSK
jgi:hypothetical protein